MSPLSCGPAVCCMSMMMILSGTSTIEAFLVPPPVLAGNLAVISTATTARPEKTRLEMTDSGSSGTSRAGFLRQGAVGVGGVLGLLGLSSPASAGLFQKDVLELEQVPARTVIGKTQTITWKEAAPMIAAMRTDAREHFANTGAKGGREMASYINQTPDGAEAIVGLEVEDVKNSPAISDGFAAIAVAPPGEYLRDDHNGKPGVGPWFTFFAELVKDGYSIKEPYSMFEVYSGQGGEETVSMYAAVAKPTK